MSNAPNPAFSGDDFFGFAPPPVATGTSTVIAPAAVEEKKDPAPAAAKKEKKAAAVAVAKPEAPAAVAAPAGRATLFTLKAEFIAVLAELDAIAEKDPKETDATWATVDARLRELAKQLEATDEKLDEKVEGWIRTIRQHETDAETAEKEAARLRARAATFERASRTMKEVLCNVLDAIGKPKVKTALFSVWTQANPTSIEIESADYVPTKFIRPPEPPEKRVEKKALIEAVEKGEITLPKGVLLSKDKRHLRYK